MHRCDHCWQVQDERFKKALRDKDPEADKLVPRDEQHWYKSLCKHMNFVSTSGLEVAISTSAISQEASLFPFLKKN